MKKRRSIIEINAEMDKINKRKPTKKQIEELGKVIQEINKGNDSYNSNDFPQKKIAISDENLGTELNGQ